MEIPSRTEIEASFARRMAKLTSSQRKRLRAAMGSPPDPTRVPPSLWEDFRRETEEELLLLIYLVFMASANYHAFGNAAAKVPADARVERDAIVNRFESEASNYSTSRATAASSSYVNTARERFQPLVNEHRVAVANNQPLSRQQVEDRLTASLGPSRAAGVATTEVTAAQSRGGDEGIEAAGGKDKGDQWITQNDQRVCPICGPLHMTLRKAWGSVYPDGPPAHVNCLLPGTQVAARGVVAAMRFWYVGPTIELRDSEGRSLTVTANHKILTRHGFVAAEALDLGDEVFNCRFEVAASPLIHPYDNHVPASIEEIFKAVSKAETVGSRQMPASTKHFNGDGAFGHGEVDVVLTALAFRYADDTVILKGKHDLPVCASWASSELASLSPLDKFLVRASLTSHGVMSSSGEPLAFIGGGACHTLEHRFASISGGKTYFGKTAGDHGTAYAEAMGGLLDRFSSFVTPHKVVSIKRDSFHGFVYDLQTESGLYNANGLLSSNCRCTIRYVNG